MNRFFNIESWKETAATLGRNKTRTALTAFGIFWGTAMLSLLLGGAEGLRGILQRQFAGFSTNMAAIFPQETTVSYRGFNKGSEWTLYERDLDRLRAQAPDAIEYMTGLVMTSGPLSYRNKSRTGTCVGARADYFAMQKPIVESGRLFNESDYAQGRKVAVIGSKLAAQLFGGEDPVGKYINAAGMYVRVIGVVGQRSDISIGGRMDENVTMPATTLRRGMGLGDRAWFAIFTLRPGHRLDELKPEIKRIVCANHPISPDDESAIGYMDMASEFEKVENLFLALSLLAMFVGGGTLMAGVIGVGNIMWIIVKERTQEIGIRRAIGARPSDIIAQIMLEGMVLTMTAGLAGVTFATVILGLVDYATYDAATGHAGCVLPLWSGTGILATFAVLGTTAGIIPSIKAMRIRPIEAINDK